MNAHNYCKEIIKSFSGFDLSDEIIMAMSRDFDERNLWIAGKPLSIDCPFSVIESSIREALAEMVRDACGGFVGEFRLANRSIHAQKKVWQAASAACN